MKFEIEAYSMQELGQRQNQEDSLYPALGKQTSGDRLFVLCDGMGGHEKGEVASATVCEAMSRAILAGWSPAEPLGDELLQHALADAYDALDAKDSGGERKMGTTMTLLCLHGGGATVAHIGDSRVYQLRPAAGGEAARIVFRTQDHSLVNDLVRVGEISEEEARHHPQKNIITRAMQPCQERCAKAEIAHLADIRAGDYFYMCSDGMLEEATDANILNIITKPGATDGQKVEMLRGATEENKDNHTAILVHISKVEGAASAASEAAGEQGALWEPEPAAPVQEATPRPKRRWRVLALVLAAMLLALAAVAATLMVCRGGDATPAASTHKVARPARAKAAPEPRAEDPAQPEAAGQSAQQIMQGSLMVATTAEAAAKKRHANQGQEKANEAIQTQKQTQEK